MQSQILMTSSFSLNYGSFGKDLQDYMDAVDDILASLDAGIQKDLESVEYILTNVGEKQCRTRTFNRGTPLRCLTLLFNDSSVKQAHHDKDPFVKQAYD